METKSERATVPPATDGDKPHERNLVGCESESTSRVPRDFTNYPQTWAFNVKRDEHGLICYAMGHDVKSEGLYQITLRYTEKKWELIASPDASLMGGDVEHEMFRQFAAHKARYLNKKK